MIKYRLKISILILTLQLLEPHLLKVKGDEDCEDSPCLNGATCINLDDHDDSDSNEIEYKCICTSKYKGVNCETPVDMIGKILFKGDCLNNGYKSGLQNPLSQCICVNGYTGSRCQIPPLNIHVGNFKNKFSACLNNGYQPKEGLPCKCPEGFYGFMCEYMVSMGGPDLSVCIRNPCRNGGICSLTSFGSYQCSCRNGFYGHHCENLLYRRTYGGFGSLLPFLLFFSLITMCIYCCCFKKNRNFSHNIINQRRFNEEVNGRNPRYHVNVDSETQNNIIYVQPNTVTNEAPKNDADLPPSYDDVVKKPEVATNNPT